MDSIGKMEERWAAANVEEVAVAREFSELSVKWTRQQLKK